MCTRSLPPLPLRLALLAAAVACASSPTASAPGDAPPPIRPAAGAAEPRFDAAQIESGHVEGDVLRLQVSYGGGCAKHDFGLLHEGPFLESSPVQARVSLTHDAHGDPCRALVGSRLRFDLSPLKRRYQQEYRQQRGAIVLLVRAPGPSGAVTTVRYDF